MLKLGPLRFAAPHGGDAATAALVGLPFALYLVVLNLVTSPSAAQWARADPILHIVPPTLTLWLVPGLAGVAAWLWYRWAPPSGAQLRRGLVHAGLGVVAACVIAGGLRLAHGDVMPSFVPPEENAGPGFLLSMTAGFGEEVLFRYALLPLVYFSLVRRLPSWAAGLLGALVTGLAFALLHDAGPDPFSLSYFVTRVVFPGMIMSLTWLWFSPSFVVAGHGAAHLLIPALFVVGG